MDAHEMAKKIHEQGAHHAACERLSTVVENPHQARIDSTTGGSQ